MFEGIKAKIRVFRYAMLMAELDMIEKAMKEEE